MPMIAVRYRCVVLALRSEVLAADAGAAWKLTVESHAPICSTTAIIRTWEAKCCDRHLQTFLISATVRTSNASRLPALHCTKHDDKYTVVLATRTSFCILSQAGPLDGAMRECCCSIAVATITLWTMLMHRVEVPGCC